MAGSEYEIELFGKKLIYSEGKLRDIKLHFFMDDLYELIKMQVGQLFDNAGDLNGLLYTTNEDITEIYVTMYIWLAEKPYDDWKFPVLYREYLGPGEKDLDIQAGCGNNRGF